MTAHSEPQRYYIAGGYLVSKADGGLCYYEDVQAKTERLEKINAEMLELLIATKRDIYPPLDDWPDDSPLKTSAKNYRRLSAWIFSNALARDFPTGTGETNG